MNTYEPLGRIRGVIPTLRFALRLMLDMSFGLFTFRNIPDTVTIYGSARFDEDHPYYKLAHELGAKLALADIRIMTGGGPGIMQAANEGARSVNQETYGCHIRLPFEQKQNKFLSLSLETDYFFVRKFILRHSSKAVIALPGGYGTLDELFECMTLIRTNCAPQMPVILIGKSYWQGLIDYIQNVMVKHGTISDIDANLIILTDDLDEAVSLIKKTMQDG